MKLSNKVKFSLISLLILLNIILRIQVEPREIGTDSFVMHIMANSLSEFGYAKWILHPASVFGLYPVSYTSTMQFLLSAISQSLGIEIESIIFLYTIIIGILSMFLVYIMAGEIIKDDLFKFLTAFGFSLSPAVLGYSTWTIPTRGLFLILAPLILYLLLKSRMSVKYVPLALIIGVFLSATHHLFYFLAPVFLSFIIIIIYSKFKRHSRIIQFRIRNNFIPVFIVTGFIFMFLIPFFTGRFIESSRYSPIFISYARYIGVLSIPAIGGLIYLIFNQKKSFEIWFLLLSLIFLTTFIYLQTYFKWFLPLFAIPLACFGLVNIIKVSENRKWVLSIVIIFLILSISFSGFYQFIHIFEENTSGDKHIDKSTLITGRWLKDYSNGSAISNDVLLGIRIFAISETAHLLTSFDTIDYIYDFITIDISEYERYPITTEDFWFSGYKGPYVGDITWEKIHLNRKYSEEFNITYVVENVKGNGRILWKHGLKQSDLLQFAYEKNRIYDTGNIYIWKLD